MDKWCIIQTFAPLQIENSPKLPCKYLNEYFAFLLDFAKMGDNESYFLLQINCISTMVNFLMGHKLQTNYVSAVLSTVVLLLK